MAAGAGFYDAQGVWQYGETDNIGTLFSDFMNVAPVSISTQFVADRSRLTTLETLTNNPTVFVAASAAARNTHWGTPTTGSTQLALQNLGATTIRTDLGIVERYFAAWNVSTNPAGAGGGAGWYPIDGSATFFGTCTRSAVSGTVYSMGASGYSFTEQTDTLGWHNPSTNPDRVTPNVAGVYRVTASSQTAANVTGNRRVQISRNSTPYAEVTLASAASNSTNGVTAVMTLNGTTDYVTAQTDQGSGSSLTVTAQLSVEFIRPTSV